MAAFTEETDQEAFIADLHIALKAGHADILEAALERIDAALQGGREETWERLSTDISATTGCTAATAMIILKCVTFLAASAASEGPVAATHEHRIESIRKAAQDCNSPLDGDEINRLSTLLKRLEADSGKFRATEIARKTIRGFLPMFEDISATVELRSTRLPLIEIPEGNPVPFKLVPIASLRLSLDSGEPNGICFQATDEDLALLQSSIELLRSEMKELRERVQIR